MSRKSRLEKPVLQTKSYYDYSDCIEYLKQQYKIDPGDMWDYLCDNIHNGSYISITSDDIESISFCEGKFKKAEDIVKLFISEFDSDGDDVEFYVWW